MARRNKRLEGFAREMRKDPTQAELRLWWELRRNQLGVRFRRQEPIGPFIVDFACLTKKLIVELDGPAHEDIAADLRRDAWFHAHGWFVLRINNEDVLENLDGVITLISQALDDPQAIEDPLNLWGTSFDPM